MASDSRSSPSTTSLSPPSSTTPSSIPQFQSPSSSSPSNSQPSSNNDQPSNPNSDRSQFSPSLIAVIVVIPVGFTALMLLYWRRRIWKRFTHLDSLPPSTPSTSAAMAFPPGGTGADIPEGQRRADRLRRTRFGTRGGRQSRSNSLRTVPEYSADPQDTEMTLAHTQQTGDPQPSFLMRLIGQHATLRPSTEDVSPPSSQLSNTINMATTPPPSSSPISTLEDDDPPPGYDCQAGSSTQGGSEIVHFNNISSSSSNEPLSIHPQSHTIDLHLDRTYTSTSSLRSVSSNRFPKPPANAIRALFHSRLNTASTLPPPPLNSNSQDLIPSSPPSRPDVYRLPSSGPTPDQIRFLESPANLSRLGVRPSSYASTDRPFSTILLSSTPAPTSAPDSSSLPISHSSPHPLTFPTENPPHPPPSSSPPPAFQNT